MSNAKLEETLEQAQNYIAARDHELRILEISNAKLVAAATRAVDAYQKADDEIDVTNAMIALREALANQQSTEKP